MTGVRMASDAKPRCYLELFLVSFAVIVLEISYTRVFSFKLFYYFTYLIIGIALLGLGAGGVLIATWPALRRLGLRRLVPRCGIAGGLAVPLGYLLIASTQLNTLHVADRVAEVLKLLLVCAALFGQFLAGGVALAAIFAARPDDMPRLYGADLLGAALACASCVPLMRHLTPPGCVMLAGLCYLLAGLRLGLAHARAAAVPGAALAAALLLLALFPRILPDPIVDEAKTMSPQRRGASRVLFSRWDPVFRVDVVEHPVPGDPHYILNHDGMWGSVLTRFDGDLGTLGRFESDPRAYPFKLRRKLERVLIIGAAGGQEILASLYFGATRITAVELNPVTVSLLTTHFADYTGHLGDDPRVTLVNAEGRSFLMGDRERYDLIWFVAPDSYAAMNAATSGAFVLSESYLYTREMVAESLRHLADGGIVCMQFGEIDFERKPNRTVRYLTTAREALRRAGIADFDRHVLVATSPSFGSLSTILLARSPFDTEDVAHFVDASAAISGSRVRHAGGVAAGDGIVGKVIDGSPATLAAALRSYPYDVRAVSDDSPFFWHFTGFRAAVTGVVMAGKPLLDPSEGAGERVLVALLALVIVMAAAALLLPFAAIHRTWREIPYKGRAAVYFAAIGMGFMFWEIVLIQKLTLFLGYPTYSLTVTLFALLVFTGLGSLASGRWRGRRDRALAALFGVMVCLSLFYQFGLGTVVARFGGAALAPRIAIGVGLLAPLGLCLGAFMPLGLLTVAGVSRHPAEFVALAWAVNGFASVVSSILAVILSMVVGFNAVLMAAIAVYLVGIRALAGIPARPLSG